MGINKNTGTHINTETHIFSMGLVFCFFVLILNIQLAGAQEGQKWITFEPANGAGKGKHIVMISGDEEYRSEEALPMLAKILTNHHGFKTTVLFAINPDTGFIFGGCPNFLYFLRRDC